MDNLRDERIPRCTNCEMNEATIIEAGVKLCEDCAEDHRDMLIPIHRARKREREFSEWKDSGRGLSG